MKAVTPRLAQESPDQGNGVRNSPLGHAAPRLILHTRVPPII